MNPLQRALCVTFGSLLISQTLLGQHGGASPRHADLVASGLIPVTVTPLGAATDQLLGELSVSDNGVEVTVRQRSNGSAPVALTALVHMSRRQPGDWLAARDAVLRMLPPVSLEGRTMVTVNNDLSGGAYPGGGSHIPGPDTPWVLSFRNFWNAADWALARATFRTSRRVLLLVTDGDHRGLAGDENDHVPDDVGGDDFVRRMRDEHAVLYVIRLGSGGIPNQLRSAAAESGGAVRDIVRIDQLSSVLQEIGSELAAQVALYVSPAVFDGRLHRLVVHSSTPDLALRSRQAYQSLSAPQK